MHINPETSFVLYILSCYAQSLNLVIKMQSIWTKLLICCLILIFSFNGFETKRRSIFPKMLSLTSWYGPVSNPNECKSDGRSGKPISKSERKPAELCTDVCFKWHENITLRKMI